MISDRGRTYPPPELSSLCPPFISGSIPELLEEEHRTVAYIFSIQQPTLYDLLGKGSHL